jgi:hypothetical protein
MTGSQKELRMVYASGHRAGVSRCSSRKCSLYAVKTEVGTQPLKEYDFPSLIWEVWLINRWSTRFNCWTSFHMAASDCFQLWEMLCRTFANLEAVGVV